MKYEFESLHNFNITISNVEKACRDSCLVEKTMLEADGCQGAVMTYSKYVAWPLFTTEHLTVIVSESGGSICVCAAAPTIKEGLVRIKYLKQARILKEFIEGYKYHSRSKD